VTWAEIVAVLDAMGAEHDKRTRELTAHLPDTEAGNLIRLQIETSRELRHTYRDTAHTLAARLDLLEDDIDTEPDPPTNSPGGDA